MNWEDATKASIDTESYYVVQTNGAEWRDFDLAIMPGKIVQFRLEPRYVRGRPVWISKITPPSISLQDIT